MAIRCATIGVPADTALSTVPIPQLISVGVRAIVLPTALTAAGALPMLLAARSRSRRLLLPTAVRPARLRPGTAQEFKRGLAVLMAVTSAMLLLVLPVSWSGVPVLLLPGVAYVVLRRVVHDDRIVNRDKVLVRLGLAVMVTMLASTLLAQVDPPPQFDLVDVRTTARSDVRGLLVAQDSAAIYVAVNRTLRILPLSTVELITVTRRPSQRLSAPVVVRLVGLL